MSIAVRRGNLQKYMWTAAACLLCISAVEIIVYHEFFWAAVPAIPLFLYLSIRKPFIFPLGAYALLLPFDAVLSVTGHTQGATLTKILGVMTMLVLLLKGSFEKRFTRPNKVVFCWTSLVLYASLTILWAIDPAAALARIPTAIGLLALYLVASFYRITEKEWGTLKTAILLGGFLASIFAIYAYFSGQFFGPTQRATLMLGNRETNPNELGLSMLMPIAICIEMLFAGKKMEGRKFSLLVVFATVLFCVILSGSRGTMLSIGIIFAVYLFSSRRKFTTALLFTSISLPGIFFMLPFLTARWHKAYSSGGAGRLVIWHVGLKAFESYWITGAGLENFPFAYQKFIGYSRGFVRFYQASHNIYLNLAVEMGITGILILFWGLKGHYALIRSNNDSNKKDKVMLTAVFWGMLAASFFDDFFWEKTMWLFWMSVLMRDNLIKKEIQPAPQTLIKEKYIKTDSI